MRPDRETLRERTLSAVASSANGLKCSELVNYHRGAQHRFVLDSPRQRVRERLGESAGALASHHPRSKDEIGEAWRQLELREHCCWRSGGL